MVSTRDLTAQELSCVSQATSCQVAMASSLTVDALKAVAPIPEKNEAVKTFIALATKFIFSEQVAKFLVETVGLRSIDDLRVAFPN